MCPLETYNSMYLGRESTSEDASHAGNKLAMQEFMILPTGAKTFKVIKSEYNVLVFFLKYMNIK